MKKNDIGGYAFSSVPVSNGVHGHVGGNTIPADIFKVYDELMNNLKEILTVTGARGSGSSEFDTATQEKIADFGNQLRSMAMQDQVNAFIRKQGIKLFQHLKQFATAPVMMKISGLDIEDPETGKKLQDEWVEFGTVNNPEFLKEYIQADLDIQVDATNLARRDIGLIRRQIIELLNILDRPGALQRMEQEGERFKLNVIIRDLIDNLETLGNADKYFDKVKPEDMAMGGSNILSGQNLINRGMPPVQGEVPQSVPNIPQGAI